MPDELHQELTSLVDPYNLGKVCYSECVDKVGNYVMVALEGDMEGQEEPNDSSMKGISIIQNLNNMNSTIFNS